MSAIHSLFPSMKRGPLAAMTTVLNNAKQLSNGEPLEEIIVLSAYVCRGPWKKRIRLPHFSKVIMS